MGLSVAEQCDIASAALMVLPFLGGLVVFFCSLCLARRRRDPARACFSYMKAGCAFFTAFSFVQVGGYAILIAYIQSDINGEEPDFSNDSALLTALLVAQAEFFAFAHMLDGIAEILIYLALVTLSLGIVLVQTGGRTKLDKAFAITSYVMAGLLGAMTLCVWGMMIQDDLTFYGPGNYGRTIGLYEIDDLWSAANKLNFSVVVLLFILAILLMARATMILVRARAQPRVRTATNILFASSVFMLLRTTFDLASQIKYGKLTDVARTPTYDDYMKVVTACVAVFPMFIILCLLLALGNKKMGGLWTTDQPFMRFYPEGRGMSEQNHLTGSEFRPQHDLSPMPRPSVMRHQSSMQDQLSMQDQPPMQDQSHMHRQSSVQRQSFMLQQPPMQQPKWDDPPPRWSQRDMHPQVLPAMYDSDDDRIEALVQALPSHDEAMGLYHQADGTAPRTEALPYPTKN